MCLRTFLLVPLAALAAVAAAPGAASAAVKTFPAVAQRGAVITFELERLDPRSIRSARVERGGRRVRVDVRAVRRAARTGGRLRLRIHRWRANRGRAFVAAKRKPKLVVRLKAPPAVTITSSPPAVTGSSDASIAFTTSGATSVDCRLDGGTWAACTSPARYSGLAAGAHAVDVRATNVAGASTASARWAVQEAVAPAPSSPPPDEHSAALLWSDEFAGAAGTLPDSANWRIATGANYNGGDDRVAYTSRPENISHDGQGNLAITIRRETYSMGGITREYTSGRVNSSGLRDFTPPVRFEARLRVPTDSGLVPAFWTLGSSYGPWGGGDVTWPDCGEVDVLEVANDPFRARYHLHGPDASGALDRTKNRDVAVSGGHTHTAPLDDGFHVYGVDILPDRIDFRFDGVTRWTITRTQYEAAGGRWEGVFDQSQYLLLNIGSLHSWVGSPTFTSSRSMVVDWVRAWRL